MPRLITYSVYNPVSLHNLYVLMFCALENQSQQKLVRMLCVVSRNKLGPETITRQHFLHLWIRFYGFCFSNLPLGWTSTQEKHLHQLRSYLKPGGGGALL